MGEAKENDLYEEELLDYEEDDNKALDAAAAAHPSTGARLPPPAVGHTAAPTPPSSGTLALPPAAPTILTPHPSCPASPDPSHPARRFAHLHKRPSAAAHDTSNPRRRTHLKRRPLLPPLVPMAKARRGRHRNTMGAGGKCKRQ